MNEKDIIQGEELERINDELFASFDPEDESWIVGGSKTTSWCTTFTPSGTDQGLDTDIQFGDLEG